MSRWLFALAYTLPVLHVAAVVGRGPLVWLPVVDVFVLMPIIDGLVGGPTHDDADAAPARSRFHDALLELWVPMQLALLVWTLQVLRSVPPVGHEWVGLALSAGLVTGAGGITIAHELMHRANPRHRALAEVLMTSVLYAHFCVEHVLGHHRNVGTPGDPATAKKGEGLYAFLVRDIATCVTSAWRIERQRCARRGIAWTLRDRRLRYALTHITLVAAVGVGFGVTALVFFLAQALVAVLLLEIVNYVEHYGLERSEVAPGKYERVEPRHSWNSTHLISGAHLFQLSRHSDHHAEANRPYWRLRTLPDAPALPAGYPTMMLATLVPPLWFRWMDPLVGTAEAGADVV